MFKTLRRKLFLTLFLIPTIFIMTLSTLLIASINILYGQDFRSNVATNVNLTTQRVKYRLELLSSEAFSFVNDVADLDRDSIVDRLSQIDATSEMIHGATYYTDGLTYSSLSLGGVQDYEEAKKDPELKDFIASTKTYSYIIRMEGIPANHGFVPYVEELGLLSLVVKSESDSLLVVDLDTNYFYEELVNFSDYQYFNDSNSYLMSDHDNLLKMAPEDEIIKTIEPDGKITSVKNNYAIRQVLSETDTNLSLYISIPKSNLNDIYFLVIFLTLGIDVLTISLVAYFANYIASKKANELEKLRRSMREDISELPTL